MEDYKKEILKKKKKYKNHFTRMIKKDKDLLSFLNNTYKEDISLVEKTFLYLNNFKKRPLCKICSETVKGFQGSNKSYRKTCSNKCGKILAKNNFIEKHGVENPFHMESVKEKIRQHNIDNHGIEYNSQRVN